MNTFYHGDCLFVMNHDIDPETIDLVYLDPPFFTGKVQRGTAKWQPGAMEVSYEDSKKFWGDTEKVNAMRTKSPEWLRHIAQTRPDFASYLFYMMERLGACKKVLKPTGSIYLHCDWRASHYLKMIMDETFGVGNFQNEVIWHYFTASSKSKSHLARKHDTLFYYTKSRMYAFNLIEAKRRLGFKPALPNVARNVKYGSDEAGYYSISTLDDVWDISSVFNLNKEFTGYPTQKPLALLERIIKSSSNEGNTILDPFCGCGTAIIAAQRLNRQWIGIDISKDAYEISSRRQTELPLDFTHFEYVSRDLDEVLAIKKPQGKDSFEEWVNRYFKAHKPQPDEGIDSITPNGIPIQTKTFLVNAKWVRNLFGDALLHRQVPDDCKHIILVSQVGFDDGARLEQSKIQTQKGIKIDLLRPKDLLSIEQYKGVRDGQ